MKRKIILTTQIILGIILVLMIPAIFSSHSHAESGDFYYQLSWNTDGVQLTDDGLHLTNNQGYSITLEEGYLVSYGMTLKDCPHSHGWFTTLVNSLNPASVSAGHSSGSDDPAEVTIPTVENLLSPTTIDYGMVTLEEPSYCEGFYLMGRAEPTAENLPNDDFIGTSLYISGVATAPDGSQIAFEAETNIAWGKLIDLTEQAFIGETLTINLQRDMTTLFDEINFANITNDEITRQVFRNLVKNAAFLVIVD